MIAGRGGQAPVRGFRMVALKILQNHLRVFDVLGAPLALRQDDPLQRPPGALFERVRQKRLRVADESDFAGRDAELLPNQAHQPVRIGAGGCVGLSAGGQNQPRALRTGWADRARHLIGESLNHQRMARIGVVVMESDGGVLAARLTDCLPKRFALQKIEVQRSRKDKDLARVPALQSGGKRVDRSQRYLWSESKYRLAGRNYTTRVSAARICDEEENRDQCSLPPMRPCLTIAASTSTMARTATSAVMSEMS
jgi:hypothetical protein